MVDCFSFSLLLGSNHPSCNSFFRHYGGTPFLCNQTMVIHRFQPLYQMASSGIYDFFFQEANTLSFVYSLNIQGVISLGCHTRPACHQVSRGSLKLCQECEFNSCVCVFFIPMGSREFYDHIWALWRHISHMGQIRDADWSRENLLRSDWLLPSVAPITTNVLVSGSCSVIMRWISSCCQL